MCETEKRGQPLRVVELFAGVGGFRLGLHYACAERAAFPGFAVVWSNQWEPASKKQWAAEVYRARWGRNELANRNIFAVLDDAPAMASLAALAPDVLVGGFPCQDYSVAKPLSQSQGLQGKKGVLWWAIYRLLAHRRDAGCPVKYLCLENVDRLIASPGPCKGRDFAVILASLQQLGYAVEWRVVNAADYGYAQRRRRIFIVGYHESTAAAQRLQEMPPQDRMLTRGVLARALPAQMKAGSALTGFELPTDILAAQESYGPDRGKSRFQSAGLCVGGRVWTAPLEASPGCHERSSHESGTFRTLGDIVAATTEVPERFFLDASDVRRWQLLKGAKSIVRLGPDGGSYAYKEGALAFPDALERPSRTIITSEGRPSPSRTTHVVEHVDGRLRRLMPEELEALNGFPRGFTDIPGISDAQRGFLMGNALVVGIVRRIGCALLEADGAA